MSDQETITELCDWADANISNFPVVGFQLNACSTVLNSEQAISRNVQELRFHLSCKTVNDVTRTAYIRLYEFKKWYHTNVELLRK